MNIVEEFDPARYYLGTLCQRQHEWNSTGKSLRYNGGSCTKCTGTKTPRLSIEARFWAKVAKSDGCWEWLAYKNPKGYGVFSNVKAQQAHRVAWQFTYGEIPEGLHCLHHCDNPGCVNPAHLYLGTNAENVADKISKGRHVSLPGEKNHQSKLTNAQVFYIREVYDASNGSRVCRSELAQRFGVHPDLIYKVGKRLVWKHI